MVNGVLVDVENLRDCFRVVRRFVTLYQQFPCFIVQHFYHLLCLLYTCCKGVTAFVRSAIIGSVPAIDYEYMRKWMESDALVKGEMPLDLYCGTDRLNVDRGVFIISGTDANGHELKFSISIDLIHEFPPESEN